jgi:transcriptional activator HAC1
VRPAVSTVGGAAEVLDGVKDDAPHGAISPPHHYLDAGFGLSAPLDTDRYVIESGLLSSPNSVDFESDHIHGDTSTLFPTDAFDISQFLNEDGNAVSQDTSAANGDTDTSDAEFSLHFADLETYFSSENLNLQPQSGASTSGCDVGGIAVGV